LERSGTALGPAVKRVASALGGIAVFGLVMYFVAGRHFGFTEGILSVVFGGGAGLALVNKQKARRLEATGVVALARIIDNASTRAFANDRQVWNYPSHRGSRLRCVRYRGDGESPARAAAADREPEAGGPTGLSTDAQMRWSTAEHAAEQ
jgi:hypothetical protein